MSQEKSYNAKSDLKRITYILTSAVMMLCIFAAFAVAVLLPIYLLSKYHPTVYSIVVLSLIGLCIAAAVGLRIYRLAKRYRRPMPLFIHLLVRFIFPITIVIFLLFFEGVLFRLSYGLLSGKIIPTIIVILTNAVIVWLLFLSRRIFFYTNAYLTNAAHSADTFSKEEPNNEA